MMNKANAKAVNYTDENVARMIAVYTEAETDEARKGAVNFLATELGKTTRSIVAKLSREKVYITAAKATKSGAKIETKAEIVAAIAGSLELDTEALESLGNATKAALVALRDAV